MGTTTLDALTHACAETGLDPAGAHLIHHSSNAVYRLPAADAIARVSTSDPGGRRAGRVHALTRWLHEEHDFPVTAPLAGTTPVAVGAATSVGFWRWYPQTDRAAPTSRELGSLLQRLHRLPGPPTDIDIPPWTPLESLHAALADDQVCAALSVDDRLWLVRRVEELRAELSTLPWSLEPGLIHGDAWAGNLLWHHTPRGDRAVLGDWDWVSLGPREIDLIPTWHATIRYRRPTAWAADFIAEYGHDLSNWPGYQLLLHMRDLVQVTGPLRRAQTSPDNATRLRQRVNDIRAGIQTSTWASY